MLNPSTTTRGISHEQSTAHFIHDEGFYSLYRQHVSALKRQGKAESTIDVNSRALRRITDFFDCPPDILTQEQFEALMGTHSWSTVKVDRNGLQLSYKYVLKKDSYMTSLSLTAMSHYRKPHC